MIDWTSAQALTFDCYGTLVDWESGLVRDLRAGLATDASDEALLAAWADVEPALQHGAFRPYRDVLREGEARVASAVGARVLDPDALVRGISTWPVFPDTKSALERLRKRFRLCIASNVDRDLFTETEASLGVSFDEVVTADQVRSYKPAPGHFTEAMQRLGVDRVGLVHVGQSRFHDVEPARALGLRTVWVDRRAGRPGGATRPPRGAADPHLTVRSLAELAANAVG